MCRRITLARTASCGAIPCTTGRLWKKDGYGWWLSRLGHALTTYDAVRIDHFRAFASYWAVDAQAKTAKVGQWLPGPGMKLFDKVFEVYPNAPIIAEDLGVFGEDVVQLLADTGFPGMKVVQFGFDPNGDSSHMPHNAEKNSINYVGATTTTPCWAGCGRPVKQSAALPWTMRALPATTGATAATKAPPAARS